MEVLEILGWIAVGFVLFFIIGCLFANLLINILFFDELVKEEAEMIKLWIETKPEWGMTCLGVEGDEITLYFEHDKGFESFCKQRFRYVMEN